MGAPPRSLIFSANGSVRGRGFGLPPRACVAYVNVLVGFMSEKVTDTAFDSTSCVGTLAAWTGPLAESTPGRRRPTRLAACGDTPRAPASALLRNVAPRSLNEQAGTGVTRPRGGAVFKKTARLERDRCDYLTTRGSPAGSWVHVRGPVSTNSLRVQWRIGSLNRVLASRPSGDHP